MAMDEHIKSQHCMLFCFVNPQLVMHCNQVMHVMVIREIIIGCVTIPLVGVGGSNSFGISLPAPCSLAMLPGSLARPL